ncbi:MAG: hypothetical protein RJB62_1478, partial [Pseudomonadota bacterium]
MIRTILVHLAGTKADDAVLRQAMALARPFAAHLECIHVRPSTGQIVSIAATGGVGLDMTTNVGEIANVLEGATTERAATARIHFDRLCKDEAIPLADTAPSSDAKATASAAFREIKGEEVAALTEALRGNDFGILAGGGTEGAIATANVAQLLVAGGRPLVLTPSAGIPGNSGTIAIAWKNSPEAARAVAAAMPLLVKARKIVILGAGEADEEAGPDSTRALLSYLAWHGVRAETR